MSLSINTNLSSLQAQRNQGRSQRDLSVAVARLSSGLRINSAQDDAAGLAIADRFTSQIRGTTQAGRNANDAISLAQTAEGALATIDHNLQRIRELAVQSANATNSSSDRASLQLEVAQLQAEIDRLATQTQFNGVNLLDGSFVSKAFQVGADAGQTISVAALASMRTNALGSNASGFTAQGQRIGLLNTWWGPNLTITFGSGSVVDLGVVLGDTKAEVTAINASGIAGLSATTNATEMRGGVSVAAAPPGSGFGFFAINGVNIGFSGQSGSANLASNRASAIAAINAVTGASGVIASDNGNGLDLVAPDGRNIDQFYFPGFFPGSQGSDFGLPGVTSAGSTLNLSYSVVGGVPDTLTFNHGIGPKTYASVGVGHVNSIDISSASGAISALDAIDLALATVSSTRALLGAVQNRFGATVGNLQTAGENVAASRSRIRDADFAVETASLSRAQVLQQAGTAMIAQANQTPSQVLALLR
ncbi:MAG: flagellin [Pseudomonadota bacterium]|nr:flagellin [Pseudomonadota bacterium]